MFRRRGLGSDADLYPEPTSALFVVAGLVSPAGCEGAKSSKKLLDGGGLREAELLHRPVKEILAPVGGTFSQWLRPTLSPPGGDARPCFAEHLHLRFEDPLIERVRRIARVDWDRSLVRDVTRIHALVYEM